MLIQVEKYQSAYFEIYSFHQHITFSCIRLQLIYWILLFIAAITELKYCVLLSDNMQVFSSI